MCIRDRYGTTYQELAALNGIADPNIIHVGQVLKVTGSVADRTYTVQSDVYKRQIPDIPKIPMLAKGGTLSSGSAIVGEKGPELLTMLDGGKARVTQMCIRDRS